MKQVFTISDRTHGPGGIKFGWQKGSALYLSIAGSNSTVFIYDRHGTPVDEINLPGACTGFSWDKDGDLLAMVTNRSNSITLWDANTKKVSPIDSSMGAKDTLTFICWAKSSLLLAVGNSKGNLLLYDYQSQRKVPIIGKHTKAIRCGCFNDKNMLALGSEDSTISISSNDGDTMYSFQCNGEPSAIQFAEMKESERTGTSDSTVSAIVAKKTLMLINLNDVNNPINLQFQSRYGNIVDYCWYGDGYVLIGFALGFVVCISTHVSEIGQEIFSTQDHKSYLSGIAVSQSFNKAITAGDSGVKVRELTQLSEVFAIVNVENADKGLDKVSVTEDGQLVAISTSNGFLHVYLTKLPVLGDAFRTKIACLSSLAEVTVTNEAEEDRPLVFQIETEPSFIGVGPNHVAIGMNNRAWFYVLKDEGAELLTDKEYLGTVQMIKLNGQFACALFDGKIHLHPIESSSHSERENRLFPDQDKNTCRITCMALTSDFLIYGTDAGHLQYFFFEDWKYINEYRHVTGIRSVHPEPSGSRLILVDEKLDGFIYNPVNDSLVEIPNSTSSIRGVLWDNSPNDKDVFVVYDADKVLTYIYCRDTIEGPKLIQIGTSKLPHGHIPLVFFNTLLTCQTQSGKTNQISVALYKPEENLQGKTKPELEAILTQAISLKRWQNGWTVCEALDSKESWRILGKAAMRHLDLEFAARVFRQMGDVGMVWCLDRAKGTEDRNLLAGDVAMFLEEFDLAERLYLESSRPVAALEMRRDLLHWDKSLQLANRLAPDQIPFISKEYAQQLEFMADYGNAIAHYEKGIIKSNDPAILEHNESCNAGIARMAIRLGDIRRGMKLVSETKSRLLKKECAQILESMKQYNEAASLYEEGNFHDKAALVYVRSKNWIKVGELLPKVHSPKIHSQFAKAMEFEGKYKLAVEAYKSAKDYDNVVRILLDKLNNPQEAVKVVRESKSVEGAKLIAKFFIKLNDHSSAIQFLVMSQCHSEAFKLAEQHDKMEIYAEEMGDEASMEDFEAVAKYFETKRKFFYAGKFYHKCGQYPKALNLLMNNGEDHESLKLAIDCVGLANEDNLTHKLINFLMGEMDGVPKDAKYLFRLYMALRMYREAAKTAVIIAGEEQLKGQYRVSHDVLFGMCQELKTQNIQIPSEMETNLMILHSYLLVKFHIRRKDDMSAARMLIRVAGNISKFPMHMVQILTSAVIECHKAGLKDSAFKFAAMLMRPEHRDQIDKKFVKKIEVIVRKSDRTEVDEPRSPCLYCNNPLPETVLNCTQCQSALPYCVVTGKHMIKTDYSLCPNCRFPALYSELRGLNAPCPMCSESFDATQVVRIEDAESHSED